MSRPRGLVRDGLVYGIGLALQRGLSFLVLPLATRILRPEEVGVSSAALVVASVLSSVFTFGLSFAIVRLYFDESPDAERTEWAALVRAQLLLGVALAGVVWLLGPFWSGVYRDVPWSGALKASVVLALAQASQSIALGVLRAARRTCAFVVVVTVQVLVGGTLAGVLADRHGPAGLVAGLAIGAGAGALLGAILTYRRPAWSRTSLRGGILLSVPFIAHMVAGWVLSLSDRVLVERYLGLERLASYQLAYALAVVPMLLTDAVQTAWLPHFYALDDDAKRALPRRLAIRATMACVAIAAIVVLAAPAIGHVLAPSQFAFPITVVALVVSATFVRTPYLLAFALLSDAKDSRSIAVASTLGALANVGLNLWLVPEWGLRGAAVSTLVAYAVMSVVALRSAEARLGRPLNLIGLVGIWAGATGLMLALSALPTDAGGWAARTAIAALVTLSAGVALRGARRRNDLGGSPASPGHSASSAQP